MDIYFCDECGSRVTDLDLRAGKGMRRRNDQICSQCVGSGQAAAWLARSGASAPAASAHAHAHANGSPIAVVEAPASTPAPAINQAPDPIAIGRDRAVTQRDDPFADEVLEPAPLAALPPAPAKAPVYETDALPRKAPAPAPAPPPTPEPPQAASPFADGFADAAGGMGALAVGPLPNREDGSAPVADDDDLADRSDEDDDLDPSAASPSAGIDVSPENIRAAKAETTVVPAKTPPRPKKASSNRQAAQGQKRGSTTSRRSVQSAPGATPSRRAAPSPMASNKVMIASLISCVVIAIIFFGFVLPNINEGKARPAQIIREDALATFAGFVKEADKLSLEAGGKPDDLALQRKALEAQNKMRSEYDVFEKAATKSGWKEEGFEQQLQNMRYHDIKGRRPAISQRIFILEQQAGHK